MKTSFRLARIIGLLALAAALAGCTALKLGYNTLDDVAYWWLHRYIDFTPDQTARVREDLARLQAWHRTQELPQLAVMLQGVEQVAMGDITASQACTVVTQVRQRIHAVVERAEPAIVTLAMELTPEQLAHLENKYHKNNADYRREWVRLSPAEQRDKRFKQFLERSETFYGRLGEPQRSALRRQLEHSVFDARRILAERQRRQQDVLQTLRKVAGQPVSLADARSLVSGYLDRAQESPDPAYRAYQQALIDEGCRTLATLHASTTTTQREAALRRLRAYLSDVRELSAQQ